MSEALASYDQAIAANASLVEAHINRAALLCELRRPAEALASSARALALRPNHVPALVVQGNALAALGQSAQALPVLQRAEALQASASSAMALGDLLLALNRPAEALTHYDLALTRQPDSPDALNNRGNALQALNRHQDALVCYARAIAFKPHDAQAHWNESLARLALGDLQKGWQKYEWRWQVHPHELPPGCDGAALWRGTPDLAGKTVLLYPEQGFGDAIQFVRYAPLVAAMGARVYLTGHQSLCKIFETVPGVAGVLRPTSNWPVFDKHAALMGLPLAFNTTLETVPASTPYLRAAQEQVDAWHLRLAPQGERFKIGIAWAGNPSFPGAVAKSCPVECFAPLLANRRVALVNLQVGAQAGQIARLVDAAAAMGHRAAGSHAAASGAVAGESPYPVVHDWSAELGDFADTAALIEALDLVITIDTAVAHLAGALGKPVWIMLPYAADWRWLRERADSPWYPSARLFRQAQIGDWDEVMGRVVQGLALRLGDVS